MSALELKGIEVESLKKSGDQEIRKLILHIVGNGMNALLGVIWYGVIWTEREIFLQLFNGNVK